MQNEDQSLRLKRRERQNQKLKKIFVAAGTAGLICGLLAGILITSVIAGFRANRTEEAFNQQLQTQKDQTSELETQFSQTAEARQEQINNAPWNLKLVNEDHPLDESFEVELQELENEFEVDTRIVDEASEMLKAGRDEGLNLVIVSAYRDNERQQEIFNQTFQQWVSDGYTYLDAYNETKKSVTLPGASEHATGLALDIVSGEYSELDEQQAETEEAKWLEEHCAEYGFILRYLPDKADVTGISFEPWHYRYVGKEAAREIMEQGITLEEYYDLKGDSF